MRAPVVDDTYVAGPETAARNGAALSVSDRADPEAFVVGATGRWPLDAADSVAAATGVVGEVRRFGSMQATLALVAAGGLDAAFASGRQHPWDTVAGVHMVRRAGGTVTDVTGDPWRHDSAGFVASNGRAHDIIVDTVAERGDANRE
jgi:myo-inositol-1(or 4)-monophosphatase